MMPLWLGEDKRTVSKSSQQALCRTHATSSRIHFSYLFDPVRSSYSCPLVHALCKKFETAFPFFFTPLTIYLPPSSCPPPNLSLPHPPSLLRSSLIFFSSSLLLGPSPCFHPFRPARTGVCVCECERICLRSVFLFFIFFPWIDCQRGQWRHCQQPGHEKCIA